jgi:hypothetical protein
MNSCFTTYCSRSRCLWLLLSVVWTTGAATATWADSEPTLWSHNGSVLYLIAKGTSREFRYEEPRPGMLQGCAHRGALLFRGQSINHQYSGTAYIFSCRCGRQAYQVSGPILDGYERVLMTGRAPQVGPDCNITGYFDDTLEFRLIKQNPQPEPAVSPSPPNPPVPPSPPTPVTQKRIGSAWRSAPRAKFSRTRTSSKTARR